MAGLKDLALRDTEPDFDLIQPRRIHWQPCDDKAEPPPVDSDLFVELAFEPCRRMRGAIIQNEDDRVHLPAVRFGDQYRADKPLEIDKPLLIRTLTNDSTITHTQSGKELERPSASITRSKAKGLGGTRGRWAVLGFARLN